MGEEINLMPRTFEEHAQQILTRYHTDPTEWPVTKGLTEGGDVVEQALPQPITHLATHELRSFDVAVGYLDLRRFTWKTFVDDARDTARLAQAFAIQCAEIVADRGGYTIAPRGDGLMFAVGSDGHAPYAKAMCALGIAAFALDMTANALNQWLEAEGLRPVQARAGITYGEEVFSWYALGGGRHLNPTGFSSSFAATCEKNAIAWQVIVGDGARDAVADCGIADLEPHGDPATYTLDGQTQTARMYRWKWEDNGAVRRWAAELPRLVAGRRPDDLDPIDVLGTPDRLGEAARKMLDRKGQVHVNVGHDPGDAVGTPIRSHDFHATTAARPAPSRSRRDASWWRHDPAALKAEKDAVRDALPGFTYEKRQRLPSWVGQLHTASRTYQVRATYWHADRSKLPVVEILHPPDLDADSTTRPMAPEHYSGRLPFGRNVPCVAAPEDWDPPRTTVVDVLAWTADWLLAYEVWCAGYPWTGERIGPEDLV
jgi:class 3 adenylate cyclase